ITERVTFTSEPSGAEARTSLGSICVTPCTMEIARKSEFAVTFVKAGYAEKTVKVESRTQGEGAAGFMGNGLFISGMVADGTSGATLDHIPNPVSVTLERSASR